MIDRRGFFGAAAAVVAAPDVPPMYNIALLGLTEPLFPRLLDALENGQIAYAIVTPDRAADIREWWISSVPEPDRFQYESFGRGVPGRVIVRMSPVVSEPSR